MNNKSLYLGGTLTVLPVSKVSVLERVDCNPNTLHITYIVFVELIISSTQNFIDDNLRMFSPFFSQFQTRSSSAHACFSQNNSGARLRSE